MNHRNKNSKESKRAFSNMLPFRSTVLISVCKFGKKKKTTNSLSLVACRPVYECFVVRNLDTASRRSMSLDRARKASAFDLKRIIPDKTK